MSGSSGQHKGPTVPDRGNPVDLACLIEDLFGTEQLGDPSFKQRLWEIARAHRITEPVDDQTLASRFSRTALSEHGTAPEAYFDYLFTEVVPHSIAVGSPRFIGHMASSLPSFVFPVSELMTALNQNVVKLETSKAFTFYERQALAMLHRLIFRGDEEFYRAQAQERESTLGILVSGGTLANIAALWCARNAAFSPTADFAGVESEGLVAALQHSGHSRAVVLTPTLVHYSVSKAVGLLGLGDRGMRRVPVDEHGRMRVDALRAELVNSRDRGEKVIAIVAVAGSTETGSVDPLPAIAELAREHRVHLHVDAAWGGPVVFSDRSRHLLDGIELADSVTIDAHKQLYMPMGLGLVLFRDPELARAIERQANYIVRRGSWDLGRRALEGSRPGMALFLHSALEIIGRRGYEALIESGLERARAMRDRIVARKEWELLAEPTLNILNYRYIPQRYRDVLSSGSPLGADENAAVNEFNVRLQELQRDRGKGFISRTMIFHTRHGSEPGVVCLRAVLSNPRTRVGDIEDVLNEQLAIARELDRSP